MLRLKEVSPFIFFHNKNIDLLRQMKKFSIITCTYNPNIELLVKVIKAILNQIDSSLYDWEYIMVDNNSFPSIRENFELNSLIENYPQIKIVEENHPGLTFARLKGYSCASGEWLVFFDDDNEPAVDYLMGVFKTIIEYPFLGVFGPGSVSAMFHGLPHPLAKGPFRYLFQERHETSVRYGNYQEWMDCFPPGSGLVVKKSIFSIYANLILQGEIKTTDRKGNSLASSGDAQIVFTAIKAGYAAGVIPELKLVHHIPSFRTQPAYMKRLVYSIAKSYWLAWIEVFPEMLNNLPPVRTKTFPLLFKMIKYFLFNPGFLCQKNKILFSGEIGKIEAIASLKSLPVNNTINLLKKISGIPNEYS